MRMRLDVGLRASIFDDVLEIEEGGLNGLGRVGSITNGSTKSLARRAGKKIVEAGTSHLQSAPVCV